MGAQSPEFRFDPRAKIAHGLSESVLRELA